MNDPYNWLEAYDEVERCNECIRPESCLRECVLDKYVHEDVAKIRDEEIHNAIR